MKIKSTLSLQIAITVLSIQAQAAPASEATKVKANQPWMISSGSSTQRIVPARNPDFVKKSSADYLAEENAIINALPNKAALMRARNSRQIKLDHNGQIQNVNLASPAYWPENVQRVARVLATKDRTAQWNYEELLFPIRNKYSAYGHTYSFQGFMNAVATFPKFCSTEIGPNAQGEDSDTLCKRALATMFAHNNQETGAHEAEGTVGMPAEWRQGLAYVNEAGCQLTGEGCGYDSSCQLSTWTGDVMACPGYGTNNKKKYFGRGAKQLSYNYNYGKFSRVLFGTEKTLLMDPDRVGQDGSLALLSAFWFFMEPQPPKPSMYDMIYGHWVPTAYDIAAKRERGFGVSTMIINGGVECGGKTEEMAQSKNRIKYYLAFANFFGIKQLVENERLGCAGNDQMMQFDEQGTSQTSFPLYWEQDWSQAGKCQLVQYEAGPFSAFYEGDYEKCVVYQNDRPYYNSTKGYHPFAPVTVDQVVYPEG